MGRGFRGRSGDDAPRVVGFDLPPAAPAPAEGGTPADPPVPSAATAPPTPGAAPWPPAEPAPTPATPAPAPPAPWTTPPAPPAPSYAAAPAPAAVSPWAAPPGPGPAAFAPPAPGAPGWGQPLQPAWSSQPYAAPSGGPGYPAYPGHPAPVGRGGPSKGVALGVFGAVVVVAVGLIATVVLPLLRGPGKLDKPATLGGFRPISNSFVDSAREQALSTMKDERMRAPMVEMYGDTATMPRVMLLAHSTRHRRSLEEMYRAESKGFNRYSGPVVLGAGAPVTVPGEQPVYCGRAGTVATVCMWAGRQSEGIVVAFGTSDVSTAAGLTAEARLTVDR